MRKFKEILKEEGEPQSSYSLAPDGDIARKPSRIGTDKKKKKKKKRKNETSSEKIQSK